ncbi:hypothetical protein LIER_22097 [Lithospermum erythrorhizon]|uniref:Uncharacterized protein n=1 Tax=Lithospermum erythrorhizon TaxID=34254 RepID=A0AAV3QSS4_LITER
MVNSMSCALVDRCSKVLWSMPCKMYCSSSFICDKVCNGLFLALLGTRYLYHAEGAPGTEEASASNSVYHSNVFPLSERTNCLTM